MLVRRQHIRIEVVQKTVRLVEATAESSGETATVSPMLSLFDPTRPELDAPKASDSTGQGVVSPSSPLPLPSSEGTRHDR